MNKRPITVDFDADSQKLMITCPFHANDLVKNLPSLRWNKSKRAWAVPLTRRNAEQIEATIRPYAAFSDLAEQAIERSKQEIKSMTPGDSFPFWYSFKTEPRKYQLKCIQRAYAHRAFAIFSEPGTGKSKMLIDLACAWRMEDKIGALLIICKYTLRDNWVDQFNAHAPLPASIHLADTTKRKQFERWLLSSPDFPVMICGTESFSQGSMFDMAKVFLSSTKKPGAAIDESTLIATHNAARSERIVSLRDLAERRLALTGTPMRDNPLNFYMQFEWLDPHIIGIGDFYAFRNRYAVMGGFVPKDGPMKGKPVQIVGYQNVDELVTTVAPYVFQITKEEAGLDLPPKRYQRRVIPMTKEQRTMYDQIRKEKAWTVKGEEQVLDLVLTQELRLHQVCGGFTVKAREFKRTVKGEERIQTVYDPVSLMAWDENPKIRELLDVIREYKSNQIIVWCMYTPEIEAIAAALEEAGEEPAFYHGRLQKEERDQYDKAFKAGKHRVMLANPQTGSMGLTWTSRNAVVVYYSNSNKFEDRFQSEDRAHRIGATGDSVMYIDLLMEKSVDLARKAALDDKKDLTDYVRSRLASAQALLDGDV